MSYHQKLVSETIARRARMAANAVSDTGIDLKRKPPMRDFAPWRKEAEPAPIVERLLDESESSDPIEIRQGAPSHRAIQAAAATLHNIDKRTLCGGCREVGITRVRNLAIFMSIVLHKKSTRGGVGKEYGNRDHTTVINSVNRVLDRLQDDREAMIGEITAMLDYLRADGWLAPDNFEQLVLPERTKHPVRRTSARCQPEKL